MVLTEGGQIMKKWYKSKTMWVNSIAAAAIIVQMSIGGTVSPEAQMGFLAVVNVVLRIATKEGLE